jgi:NRPS condensation-like uncharacterized protein
MRLPLNAIDEMFLHLDDPARPLTIQLEARVQGRLDDQRVRDAVQVATQHHPLARARLLPWTSDARAYEWEVDDVLQVDPVQVVDSPAEGGVDVLRGDLYSRAIPLTESPPFRVQVVHDPGGDVLMLAVNHVAGDGIGVLRLLQSIGRAYGGVPDPTVDLDPVQALEAATSQDDGGGDRAHTVRLAVQQLVQLRARATQVAAKDPSSDPGYGVHTMSLPAAPLAASPLRREAGATVNDVLLAATHRAIDEWNRQQGEGSGRIALGVPVNARADAWRDEVLTNLITSEVVWTNKDQRASPEACLEAVTAWTQAVKRRGSGAALAAQAKGWGGRVGHRRKLRGVVRAVAGYLSGTAALSNLGRVPADWVDADDFEVTELWVSPPAFGNGLGVGAVSTRDVLHLALRSHRGTLSDEAAAEFAGVLRAELDRYAAPV